MSTAGDWLVLLIYLWACAMPATLGAYWMFMGGPTVAMHEMEREDE